MGISKKEAVISMAVITFGYMIWVLGSTVVAMAFSDVNPGLEDDG